MIFWTWLRQQRLRDDRIGDFARDAMADPAFPRRAHAAEPIRRYLRSVGAIKAAIAAFEAAHTEYVRDELIPRTTMPKPISPLTIAMSSEDLAEYSRHKPILVEQFRKAAEGSPQLSVFDAGMELVTECAGQIMTSQPAVGPPIIAAIERLLDRLKLATARVGGQPS